ncbi:MAG: hypothetical protein IJO54_06895 [Oscillospiraceae bacterium]|nr:hypothetical protein [Oscillospiraceae bacterium]
MAIGITDKFKPKGVESFALMDAEDIAFREGRLSEYMPVCLTEEEYNSLEEINPKTPYLIKEEA